MDVTIRGATGARIIAPPDAPTADDGIAGVDVAVLIVPGGHLTWSVLASHTVPAAVLDDLDAAQEWVWAIYGADVALALETETTLPVSAGRPELATALHRLGYAQWAARWWPASLLDAIPPLPADLLAAETAELAAACDSIVDDVLVPISGAPQRRAEEYALAAGGAVLERPTAVLARGVAENDWRTCPPRVLDAAENAATWTVERRDGNNVVRVAAVAAPDLDPALPGYLRPHAVVTGAGSFELALAGDLWAGEAGVGPPGGVAVAVEVPGFGVSATGGRAERDRVRAFARRRLVAAAAGTSDWLLRAEIAAALADPDF